MTSNSSNYDLNTGTIKSTRDSSSIKAIIIIRFESCLKCLKLNEDLQL